MAKFHWFFNYEGKDWRIVADTFEGAKQGMANVIGKPYTELAESKKVRFDRVETSDGDIVYKAQ